MRLGTRDQRILERVLSADREILFAFLFGSQARGQAGPLSDIDTAVFLHVPPERFLDKRLDLMVELSRQLGMDQIDVLVLNEAPLTLAYRVLRDGVLLVCRDRDHLVRFKAEMVSRYLDFQPFLERYERAVLERIRNGGLLDGYDPYPDTLARYLRFTQGLARAQKHQL